MLMIIVIVVLCVFAFVIIAESLSRTALFTFLMLSLHAARSGLAWLYRLWEYNTARYHKLYMDDRSRPIVAYGLFSFRGNLYYACEKKLFNSIPLNEVTFRRVPFSQYKDLKV